MATITKAQARLLAEAFSSTSVEVAKIRYDRWETLSAEKRSELGELDYQLTTASNAMYALAGILTLDEATAAIGEITDTIQKAEKFLKKVATVKKVITVVGGILSLAGAVLAKDPQEIFKELKGIKELIK